MIWMQKKGCNLRQAKTGSTEIDCPYHISQVEDEGASAIKSANNLSCCIVSLPMVLSEFDEMRNCVQRNFQDIPAHLLLPNQLNLGTLRSSACCLLCRWRDRIGTNPLVATMSPPPNTGLWNSLR
jgi:hypothetical protein